VPTAYHSACIYRAFSVTAVDDIKCRARQHEAVKIKGNHSFTKKIGAYSAKEYDESRKEDCILLVSKSVVAEVPLQTTHFSLIRWRRFVA
jgi:hypothetical protein